MARGGKIRSVGIDDGPFVRGQRREVFVAGAVYSAGAFEGLLSTRVRQDGHNATDRLIAMLSGSKFLPQLHLCLLDGLTLGGFNVVDLPRLHAAVHLPCLAVTRKRPDMAAIEAALDNLSYPKKRRALMAKAGPFHQAKTFSFQVVGLDPGLALRAVEACVVHGNLPEALRAAHLITRGVVEGQSGNRA